MNAFKCFCIASLFILKFSLMNLMQIFNQDESNHEKLFVPYMRRVVRKPAFCICENKDADQLRGNCEADQRLCFCYTDSTIPLLPKSEISSL